MKCEFRKVYLGDDEPCDIIRKGIVMVSLSSGSTLKLRNVTCTKVEEKSDLCQSACGWMKTTFDSNVCKITKGDMVMTHDKKKGALYMTSGSGASISVASSELDARAWHQRLRHMSEKGTKVMLLKDKLLRLKSINLDFYKDCVYGK